MQRIRKQNGKATIKVLIEKECAEADVEATLDAIQAEVEKGFKMMENMLPFAVECKIDKDMNMYTKHVLPAVDEPEEA